MEFAFIFGNQYTGRRTRRSNFSSHQSSKKALFGARLASRIAFTLPSQSFHRWMESRQKAH